MNLTKKFIFISTALIIILSSLILSSFAIEEKDHINQALKFIDEEKYNEAVVELEEVLMLVKSKSSLEFVSVVFANEEAVVSVCIIKEKTPPLLQEKPFLSMERQKIIPLKKVKIIFMKYTSKKTSIF